MMCESTARHSHVSQLSRGLIDARGKHTAALLRVHDCLVLFGDLFAMVMP